ncbi:MAG TPA: low affinity iron permease family protein [Candidatus Saccharimonadales bacterium]|nr:low affinity iron permease family protein [Candidatus Saccharimonadales bacterium]
MNDLFRKFAHTVSNAVGSSWAFIIALLSIIIWAITGPLFHYSETWQLVINTGTTIITFLMIFLVQNSQNRDAKSMQLKLDELIHAQKNAHNKFMAIEEKSDEELERVHKIVENEKIRRRKKKIKK